ncbi:Heavy metal-dependent transcription regulator 2 [Paraburkholderia piptadeniae]|uniref:Cu(I)-responsive transcriptional regulator n=2 Tax=Paraburkholderia TaxID=1822464 RepID=A0A7X1NEF2_9BURK|nr:MULTISPECIES: Cu(I)-responsive transcriptional regulator [Paraburkholderia]MPW20452.1 Cu(I)-responsive transcriptional regulator [Paraburkholderia franconis]SIT50897.1 Heavy metal-dependent transcription regulator 2 [Paraburkholderia piptadeniae]
MNIGEVSSATGISTKMIRHYEGLGLLPRAIRTSSGYRQYSDKDVSRLRFIRRSRDLGFSLERVGELLELWQNRERSSRQVKTLAQTHMAELDGKLKELQEMKAAVDHLIQSCNGDDRPDCPIIDSLASEAAVRDGR